MQNKNFLFLAEPILINKDYYMFSDVKLTRATESQIEELRFFLSNYSSVHSFNINLYECKVVEEGEKKYILSDEKIGWKYFVFQYEGNSAEEFLPLVFQLSSLNLTVIIEGVYLSGNLGIMISELTAYNYYYDNKISFFETRVISQNEVDELNTLYDKMKNFWGETVKYSQIKKALLDFGKLSELSKSSPFKVLAYLSIFELLLVTYDVKGVKSTPIKYQLQNKLNLLNNLIDNSINFKEYFTGPDTLTFVKVIGKLYEYRNAVAHGNFVDFENSLQIISNNEKNVLRFLRDLLKKVLLFSISNPQLVLDLKSC